MTSQAVQPASSQPPKTRMSKTLKRAIELMVLEGLTRAEAAEQAGMTDHGLYVALRKPHVQAYRKGVQDELREQKGNRAYLKTCELSEKAASEHVQLEASKFVAGVGGIAPLQRHKHEHSGHVSVGYVLDLRPDPARAAPKDVTPQETAPLIEHQATDGE